MRCPMLLLPSAGTCTTRPDRPTDDDAERRRPTFADAFWIILATSWPVSQFANVEFENEPSELVLVDPEQLILKHLPSEVAKL